MGIVRKTFLDLIESAQDAFTYIALAIVGVFIIGQLYGAYFEFGTAQGMYPLYVFGLLLILQILRGVLRKAKK